jgi:hypothetical protein
MSGLVATPFITIASNLSSHRAAQGVIYADQLKQTGRDITVNMTRDLYHEDFNKFDDLYVYHGNDFSGGVNLFGGMKAFPYVDNFRNFSKFKGNVYSLVIPYPSVYAELKKKYDEHISKDKEIDPLWHEVDWNNLVRMEREAVTIDPNLLVKYPRIAAGDSHAICMYRPGWMNNSVPFKTLHGALKVGIQHFIKPYGDNFEEIEFYFGNIDIRHHICRQDNSDSAIEDLVKEYVKQAKEVANEFGAKTVRLYELLPPENESRSLPKTGFFKGTPFYGTWSDRNNARLHFKYCLEQECGGRVEPFFWVDKLINNRGELDFSYMERPHSVHLSREYYPHWQGREWNGPEKKVVNKPIDHVTLEGFFLS